MLLNFNEVKDIYLYIIYVFILLADWEGKDEMKSFCVFSALGYVQKLSLKIDFLYSDVA